MYLTIILVVCALMWFIGCVRSEGFDLFHYIEAIGCVGTVLSVICIFAVFMATTDPTSRLSYQVVKQMIDDNVRDEAVTKQIIHLNHNIEVARLFRDSKWTNWCTTNKVADLELLSYPINNDEYDN